jgi:Ni,Fe-hydrogenase I large subunit
LQKFVESHSKHFEHLAGYDYQKIAEKLKVPYKKQNYWLRVDSEYRKNQYFKPFGWLNTKIQITILTILDLEI